MKINGISKMTFGDYNSSTKSGARVVIKDNYSHIEICEHWKSDTGRNMSKFSTWRFSNEDVKDLIDMLNKVVIEE